MNFIGSGIFLLGIALLFSHYYDLNPPKSQILSVVTLLMTVFLWYGITKLLGLRTHLEPGWVGWIIFGAVVLFIFGIRLITGSIKQRSGTLHWLFFLSGSLVYVIAMFVLVETGTLTLH